MLTKEDFMKLDKERLADLLVEMQEELSNYRKFTPPFYPNQPIPTYPTYPYITWDSSAPCFSENGVCTNKFHDCINCPKFAYGTNGGESTINFRAQEKTTNLNK